MRQDLNYLSGRATGELVYQKEEQGSLPFLTMFWDRLAEIFISDQPLDGIVVTPFEAPPAFSTKLE